MRDFDELGWEWAAWWAIQGDESLELVHKSAVELQKALGVVGSRLHDNGDIEGSKAVAAANLFMIVMAEMLNRDGTSMFKATISHRGRGQPIKRHQRALIGRQSAAMVEKLVAEGWKQEAAVKQAEAETGLSRAEIMAWLSSGRKLLSMAPEEIAARFYPGDK